MTPGTEIYLKNDVSREVSFVERGEVEVIKASIGNLLLL